MVHATAGNMNNGIGLPLTILATPSDADLMVLELGMSALGEIALLTRICAPTIGLVTCVAPAHLQGVCPDSLPGLTAVSVHTLRAR